MVKKYLIAVLAIALCAPVFVSCSDDDDDKKPTEQELLQEEVKKQVEDIVKDLEADEDLKAFTAALKKFDVTTATYKDDNLTVFAFPDEALTKATGEGEAISQNLLKRHIALGKYTLEDLKDLTTIKMANNEEIDVTKNDDGIVFLNGVSLSTPQLVSNSIVYKIDTIIPEGALLPPSENAEHIKEDLSNLGLELMAQMQDLADNKGFIALNALYYFNKLSKDDVSYPENGGPFLSFLPKAVLTKSDGGIKEEIADLYGEYVWNADDEEWDYISNPDSIIVKYPATKAGESNNARIVITADIPAGAEPYAKVDVKAEIYVDDKVEGTITSAPTQVSIDKYPATAPTTITLGEYVMDIDAKRGKPNTTSFTFKKDKETLFEGSAIIDADLDAENPVLGKSSAEVIIWGQYTVKGEGDIVKFRKEREEIREKYNYDDEGEEGKKMYEEIAASFNNNVEARLYDSDDKEVATVTLRAKIDDEYGDYTFYTTGGVFEFFDDSRVDVDVYFGTGFEDVIKAWQDFIGKLN